MFKVWLDVVLAVFVGAHALSFLAGGAWLSGLMFSCMSLAAAYGAASSISEKIRKRDERRGV